MGEALELQAYKRTVIGREVKRLRREGIVPGVVYGHGFESMPIQMRAIDLEKVIRKGAKTKLVDLHVGEGKKRKTTKVLMREVQRDPVKLSLVHVDFQAVSMTEKLRLKVPIRLTGEAPMVERNEAVLVQVLDEVEIECLPGNIPTHLEADVSPLDSLDKSITVADIQVPEGVEILADEEDVIANLSLTSAAMAEAGEEEEGAEMEAGEVEVVGKGKSKEGEESEEGEE